MHDRYSDRVAKTQSGNLHTGIAALNSIDGILWAVLESRRGDLDAGWLGMIAARLRTAAKKIDQEIEWRRGDVGF
jgi:hypothetical protein